MKTNRRKPQRVDVKALQSSNRFLTACIQMLSGDDVCQLIKRRSVKYLKDDFMEHCVNPEWIQGYLACIKTLNSLDDNEFEIYKAFVLQNAVRFTKSLG